MVQGKKEFKNRTSMLTMLEKDELDALDEIRWRERTSRSEVGRKAIIEYIKSHGTGNDTFKITEWQDPNFKAMPATMSSKDKWNEYIRQHMNKEERKDLQDRAKYMLKIIEAQDWKEENKK